MIQRVQHIKAFGVFADFHWPADLPEFKKFNLIYGWNYSGKTTLSRAFRCFEQQQPHIDFAEAQVQLKSENGAVHHLYAPHTAPVFRVFNSDYLLDEESLAQCLSVFRSTDKKPALIAKSVSLSSVTKAAKKAVSLLARIVTANNPILRLKENPAVESWIKEGRPLHDGKNTCQFCGQPLPSDLIIHLAGHFSADYENLMAELNALMKEIQVAQGEQITLNHRSDFYTELSDQFTTERNKLDELIKVRKSALETLVKALVAKQTKAFTSLECPTVDDPAVQIDSVVEAINKIISEHNNRTAEFDKKRQEAHYSHNTTITRSLTIPDTSECKAVVQACLKAVREWDADYFKDLEVEVN